MSGISVSQGIAIEKPYIYKPQNIKIDTSKIANDSVEDEINKVNQAVIKAKSQLEDLKAYTKTTIGEEEAEIFEAHCVMLEDPMLQEAILTNIKNLKHAEAAVDEARISLMAMFESIPDPYIKARMADIDDVSKRLIRILLGVEEVNLGDLKEPVIVVAKELTPSDTVTMNNMVKGIIAETGSETSHAAIMAKAMGLPAMVGVENAMKELEASELIILDTIEDKLIVNPDNKMVDEYKEKLTALKKENNRLKGLKDLEAVTEDNHVIKLYGNIGSTKEIDFIKENGGKGIGLVRTEFLYMDNNHFPTEEEQFIIYKEIVENGGEEVIIRTLDIGGDKALSYYSFNKEMNPFLGYRAIRFCLGNTEIFKTQLRAILRASAFGNAKIMFPMIASYEELMEAKALLEQCKNELTEEGAGYNKNISIGIMIEIPAAAMIADVLIKEVDFFSIGTNDLCQYTLAVDRTNEAVANLYQPLHPAVLRIINLAKEAAVNEGKSIGMCGELAGDPLATMVLVGLGLDKLSMSASSIPKVKEIIRKISYKEAKKLANKVLKCKTSSEIKEILREKQ